MDDDPDLLRERLRRAGHPAVMAPTRLRASGRRTRDAGRMSESSAEHADPGWPHLASAAARVDQWAPGASIPSPVPVDDGTTGWAPAANDYAPRRSDGRSTWGGLDAPAAVPPPIPGVGGPQARPGWLMAGRGSGEPDGDGAA